MERKIQLCDYGCDQLANRENLRFIFWSENLSSLTESEIKIIKKL